MTPLTRIEEQRARIASGAAPVVEVDGRFYTNGDATGSHWVEVGHLDRLPHALHDDIDRAFCRMLDSGEWVVR